MRGVHTCVLLCVLSACAALPADYNPSEADLQPVSKDATPPVVATDKDHTRPENRITPLEPKPFSYIQTILTKFLQPEPLLDSIKEEEKYGNEGERFMPIGRSVVSGVSAFTNFLGTAVEYPIDTLKSFTRKATATLNDFGKKLISL